MRRDCGGRSAHDPPATRAVSCGFIVGPNAEFSVDEPIANSSMFVLPTKIAPSARSRSITVASNGGTNVPRICDAQVVRMPLVA